LARESRVNQFDPDGKPGILNSRPGIARLPLGKNRPMPVSVSIHDFEFDKEEIERRRQLTRDLWAGKPLDHIPVYITVQAPSPRYSVREQFLDA
jgi:hypothetical protein